MPSCCGGVVVPRSHVGAPPARPGDVLPAMPSWGSLSVHLVRLGHPADVATGSWSGTALCGRTYRSRYWFPLQTPAAVAAAGEACKACEENAERTREELA